MSLKKRKLSDAKRIAIDIQFKLLLIKHTAIETIVNGKGSK